MKNGSFLKDIKLNKRYISYSIISLLFVYYLIGILPITRFETDSMSIANACEEILQSGNFGENVLSHSYHMQSGTYFFIVIISKFSGFSAFVSYSIITIISAIVYWVFLLKIIRRITQAAPALIITVLFLFQEIFVLSYYANSAVIASAFWIVSFYLVYRQDDRISFLISGLLLALAAWMRVDIAFTFPSVLILLYMKKKNFNYAIKRAVILGLIVIVVTPVLMHFMKANIQGFLWYTDNHGELFRTDHNLGVLDLHIVKAHLAYFSMLMLVLISFSLVILLKRKEILPILFLIMGIVFYYMLGINNTVAPKHLSYFTLFWAVVIITGLKYYRELGRFTRIFFVSAIILTFLTQYLVGVRVHVKSIPYQFKEYVKVNPEPTLIELGKYDINNAQFDKVEVVIGTGTKISTSDEINASSGLFFTPLMWYYQKSGMYHTFNELSNIFNNSMVDTVFINVTDGSTQYVINSLLTNNYTWLEKKINFNESHWQFTFKKQNSPIVRLDRYTVTKKNFEEYINYVISLAGEQTYFLFIWDWQNYFIRKMNSPNIETIGKMTHRIIPGS